MGENNDREIVPPVTETNPDRVRGELVGIARALVGNPLHAVRTWEDDAQRLAVLAVWIDEHCTGGGPLPTPWAPRPDADPDAEDRPVADVALPEGEILTARGRLAARARQAAGDVRTAHRPARSRADPDRRHCVACGQPWPCETATLGAAVAVFAPAALWLAAHRPALVAALTDAAGYRDPEGGECGECEALNRDQRREDGGRRVLCLDCGEDEQTAKAHEQLRAELEGLDL